MYFQEFGRFVKTKILADKQVVELKEEVVPITENDLRYEIKNQDKLIIFRYNLLYGNFNDNELIKNLFLENLYKPVYYSDKVPITVTMTFNKISKTLNSLTIDEKVDGFTEPVNIVIKIN
ncbi:MAG: hypothetical protein GX490_08320 [Bacilli bacterium]|nr:hypothetical protein [Bacilli bacterium]